MRSLPARPVGLRDRRRRCDAPIWIGIALDWRFSLTGTGNGLSVGVGARNHNRAPDCVFRLGEWHG